MPRKAPSALRLVALCLLLIAVTLSVGMLSNSNLLSSPNQTLRIFDANLNSWTKQLLNSLWGHNNIALSPTENLSNPTMFYRVSDPAAVANLQQIMPAIDALNKQVEQGRNDPSYHNRLGILYAQIGDFSSAIQHLNQAVSLCREQLWYLGTKAKQPNTLNVKTAEAEKNMSYGDRSSIYVQLDCAHSNLARIYDKLGDHKQVISELEELNKDIVFAGDVPSRVFSTKKITEKSSVNQASLKNRKLTATEAALLARAEALRQVGRLAEAIQEYIKLINLNPNLAIAHQRLGLAAVTDNNLWLAINELQTSAQLDKGDPDTQNDLGLVYQQIGDSKSAKQSFANAHKIDPKHLSASINLANSLANSGDYKTGIAIMRKATFDHPKSATAHNNLASLIARTNNPTEAAKEFARAIHLNPNLASAHYGLGIALLKLKSYPAAAKEFQIAMTLNPGILDLQNKIDLANRCNLRSLAYTQNSFN